MADNRRVNRKGSKWAGTFRIVGTWNLIRKHSETTPGALASAGAQGANGIGFAGPEKPFLSNISSRKARLTGRMSDNGQPGIELV
jgi:hypothetical protein